MSLEKVLPPGVNGKLSGQIKVKVDEVFWTRKSSEEVLVELQWWGEKEKSVFRPEDITFSESKKNEDTVVTYNIRTNPGLFETYLKNCGKIIFQVHKRSNRNVIVGSAIVKDIDQIIAHRNYQSYFPIFSPKGNRIGDLHVGFEITYNQKETCFRINHATVEPFQTKNLRKKGGVEWKPGSPIKSSSEPSSEDKVLSEVLQRGHELRKAMVMSVLQDCPIDSLESVVNYRTDLPPATKSHSKRQEAKLIDFLLGKEMTPDEEVKALETLRCISPAESLVEIAKTAPVEEQCKITKSKCCLHGKRCRKARKTRSCPPSQQSVPVSRSDTDTGSSGDRLRLPPSTSDLSHRAANPPSPSLDHFKSFDEFEKPKPPKPKKDVTNCYRLTVVHLTLTADGVRKIYYAPCLKGMEQSKCKHGRNHHPPGTSFTVELSLPSRSVGHQWARTLKFVSKNYKGHRVYFGESMSRRASGELSWGRLCGLLQGCVATVTWRHLNQRIPCPLGTAVLDSIPPEAAPSAELSLPVVSTTRLLTGHLRLRVDLGHVSPRAGEPVFPASSTATKTINTKEDGGGDLVDQGPGDEVTQKSGILPGGEARKQSDLIETAVSKESANSSDGESSVVAEHCLDAELLRAIDLLNSGAERQEACVQTTPPLTTECPTCRTTNIKVKDGPPIQRKAELSVSGPTRDASVEDDRRREVEDEWHLDPEMLKKHKSRRPQPPELERRSPGVPQEARIMESEEAGWRWQPSEPARRRTSSRPTVHEFTLKVDRVGGVPLFTGDTDADCYVDYAFPEVDCTGKLVYSRVCSGTEVKMALRQTDFSTVTRHSLRLRSPLTEALLSLPSHQVPLWLWLRLYHPPPSRDYKIAQASIPLTKLSNLELKYEQQLEKKVVFEKIVLPLTVVESSMTSGYRGNFGEIEVTLGYSCASTETYRDWLDGQGGALRERMEPQRPLGDCADETDGSPNRWRQFDTNGSSISTNFRTFNGCNDHHANVHFDYMPARKYESYKPPCACARYGSHTGHHCSSSCCPRYNSRCDDVVSRNHISVPARKKDGNYDEDPLLYRTDENREYGYEGELKGRGIVQQVLREMQLRRMQLHIDSTAKENLCPDKLTEEKNSADLKDLTESKLPGSGDRPENVITLQRVSPVGGGGDGIEAAPELTPKDAFESFDLRVDLPDKDETEDFEVRSRLSFLQTPPPDLPVLPGFKHCKDMVYLESDSSSSIRERIQKQDVNNPFSSNSNMSLLVDSDSSIFKIPEPPQKSGIQKKSDKDIGKDKEIIKVKNKRMKRSKCKKQTIECSNSDKENIMSDNTLNSVESLVGEVGRESRDVGVATELVAEHKDTQTSYNEENLFRARVEICRALGLPSVETRLPDGRLSLVKPTSFAYFSAKQAGKDVILKTPVVERKTNPVWDSVWDVQLPVDLLKKCDSELEICVEVSGGGAEATSSDPSLGRSGVSLLRASIDLTPVTAGLANASGWFSLADKACVCRAQIKVVVTPLEDASRFRDDWLKEYTKTRSRRGDAPSFSSQLHTANPAAIATSLQEKLGELERLTQRMKDKMATRDRWDLSPPFPLLEEVRDVNLPDLQLHGLVEMGTSPIVLSPVEENRGGDVVATVPGARRSDTEEKKKETEASRKRSCSNFCNVGPTASPQTPLLLSSDDDGDGGEREDSGQILISVSSEDEEMEKKPTRPASSPLQTYTVQSWSGEGESSGGGDEDEKGSCGETPSETICRILGRLKSRERR